MQQHPARLTTTRSEEEIVKWLNWILVEFDSCPDLRRRDPPVSGVLNRLAALADQAARDAKSADRIIERDTENREAVIFIRTLAKNFHSYFGEALRGTLANFATAALGGADVSKGDVDSALRGFDFSAP